MPAQVGMSEIPAIKVGSAAANLCYEHKLPARCVSDYRTMKESKTGSPPDLWAGRSGANAAAANKEHYAVLVGRLDFFFDIIHPADFTDDDITDLCAEYSEIEDEFKEGCGFDGLGQFKTPNGQIPLGRLFAAIEEAQVSLAAKEDSELLFHLYALQNPESSQWRQPFLRLVSNHELLSISPRSSSSSSSSSSKSTATQLHVIYYVYFTRLLFELIADTAVKGVMDRLTLVSGGDTICEVDPVVVRKAQPTLFTPSGGAAPSPNPALRFSLGGLMKHAESSGYGIEGVQQPAGLDVKLFDFQLSTYKWMLDQETNGHGINKYFWEERRLSGGFSLYYFPQAGVLRLERPPASFGGLLCEEMGLGKTVEVLALVLGNPRPPLGNAPAPAPAVASSKAIKILVPSRATLIIVPTTLMSQWWKEIHARVEAGAGLRCVCVTDERLFNQMSVPPGDFRNREAAAGSREADWGAVFPPSGASEVRVPWSDAPIPCEGRDASLVGSRMQLCLKSLRENLHEFDIVITNYESLRGRSAALLKKIEWHRIVLDECQEIKVPTNQIAVNCATLSSRNRWMVSGTPLCTSINDLHGELNFLQVWPFSLSDNVDGFWNSRVATPFRERSEAALQLLHSLMGAVMMRHSKSQQYLDGRPLVKMAPRTIEYKGFALACEEEKYVLTYLGAFAADALQRFLEENRLLGGAAGPVSKAPMYMRIKSLLPLISRAITHTETINLQNLDHLRRMFNASRAAMAKLVSGAAVQILPPDAILQILQSAGQGALGGSSMNRSTNRTLANTAAAQDRERRIAHYEHFDVKQLRAMLQEQDLPVPYSWRLLPYRASVAQGRDALICNFLLTRDKLEGEEQEEAEEEDELRVAVERKHILSVQVQEGSALRLVCASSDDMECRALLVTDEVSASDIASFTEDPPRGRLLHMGSVQLADAWHGAALEEAPLYLHTFSARKQPYVDLLVAKEGQTKAMTLSSAKASSSSSGGSGGGGVTGGEAVGEHGFATLFTFMAGRNVECALCLGETVRPTITRCVHAFCLPCILDVIDREKDAAKCPICRRKLEKAALIEVDTSVTAADSVEAEGEEPPADSATQSPSKAAPPPPMQQQQQQQQQEEAAQQPASEPVKGRVRARRTATSKNSSKKAVTVAVAGSSSSSSSSAASASAVCETKLIVPDLALHSSAAIASDLADFPRLPAWEMRPRDARFPSLDSAILTYLDAFKTSKDCLSSRMEAVLGDMDTVRAADPLAKFVIFSQHIECLVAVDKMLRAAERIRAAEVGGDTSAAGAAADPGALYTSVIFDGRAATRSNISIFIEDPACTVCLLTTGAAASGLTLTVAQTCYFLEPTHEAAEEAQALNRVHRIGQARPVRCVVFYAEDTYEERLLALRNANGHLTQLLVDSACAGVQAQWKAPELKGKASRKRRQRSLEEEEEEDEEEEEEEEAVGPKRSRAGQKRKKSGAPAAATAAAGVIARKNINFFSVENLCVLFGLTDERRARSEQLKTVVELLDDDEDDANDDEEDDYYPRFGGHNRAPPMARFMPALHTVEVVDLGGDSDSEFDSDFFDDD